MKRTFTAAIGTAVAATLLDPTRIVMTAIVLGRARKANPEMFDGHAAALAVDACLKEES
jgi:hypothetical protein